MTDEIRIPEVSEGVTEGIVVGIVVAVGDVVEIDQTLLELETDKAVIDIPSPHAGKITEIRVTEGDNVAIDAVFMLIETDKSSAGDAVEPDPSAEEQPESEVSQDKQSADKPATEAIVLAVPVLPPPVVGESEVDLVAVRRGDSVAPAAPSVRRLARELGVDIYQVRGTGPGERISAKDVRNFVRDTLQRIAAGGPLPGQPVQPPLPDFTRWGEVSQEPLSRVRELTAEAMSYAWSTIPMVTQYDHARVTEIEAFRKEFNLKADNESRLTMTAILVKICAAALREFPRFNSSLDLARKELIIKQSVHIGVAVDTPNGLLVPVLRDADAKGVERLALELNEVADKTRARKISPAEMEGGTFTISNLGGVGGIAFTPIVYAPQVAILGVSTAEIQPVWNGQDFVAGLVMPLSLTYDHRVIDGAEGARFLRWICKSLEQPLQLVMKG